MAEDVRIILGEGAYTEHIENLAKDRAGGTIRHTPVFRDGHLVAYQIEQNGNAIHAYPINTEGVDALRELDYEPQPGDVFWRRKTR